jgi:hypothetical protein
MRYYGSSMSRLVKFGPSSTSAHRLTSRPFLRSREPSSATTGRLVGLFSQRAAAGKLGDGHAESLAGVGGVWR